MAENTPFQMSQGIEVLTPKSGRAYPIPCDEWHFLRTKISKATSEPFAFHTVGSALLGMALSALAPILSNSFQLPAQQRTLDLTWLILISSAICALACLYFAQKERQVVRDRASDVIAQMQLIEQRFERAPE